MKSPLWMLNSAFIIIFIIMIGLMLLSRTKLPKRSSLRPRAAGIRQQRQAYKVNPAAIYENDLFGTYLKPIKPREIEQIPSINIPAPPPPKEAKAKVPLPPKFLPRLGIELKGIVFNSNNAFSRAIIEDLKTKAERLLKIGDLVEDASLIYISRNKIIFIRSNGQQESLFVTEDDAKDDPIYNTTYSSDNKKR